MVRHRSRSPRAAHCLKSAGLRPPVPEEIPMSVNDAQSGGTAKLSRGTPILVSSLPSGYQVVNDDSVRTGRPSIEGSRSARQP